VKTVIWVNKIISEAMVKIIRKVIADADIKMWLIKLISDDQCVTNVTNACAILQ